jgi:hypothetical protein
MHENCADTSAEINKNYTIARFSSPNLRISPRFPRYISANFRVSISFDIKLKEGVYHSKR